MKKFKEFIKNLFKKNEEDGKMKQKWTTKKKLLVGAVGIGAIIGGIFAFGKGNDEYYDDEDYDFEDDFDSEDYESEFEEDSNEVENETESTEE